MDNESSLLAYLVPRLTSRGEDTATDALAFILNKSEACRGALDSLLSEQGLGLAPITRFETQVKFDDGCRPDMVGYDSERRERLVVESKFWAALLEGQASCYFGHIEESEPGILLFVAPATRIETLWAEITRQMEAGGYRVQSESVEILDRMRRAEVDGFDKRLMLISWDRLLQRLDDAVPAESLVASDIRQLRGLAQQQDMEAFKPIQPEELSPSLAHRILWLNKLIDDAVDRGVQQCWMSVKGLKATPQRAGYGRYLRFLTDSGARTSYDSFLCVTVDCWATMGDTPLWLWIGWQTESDFPLRDGSHSLRVFEEDGGLWTPIHLKVGVEYHRVLDDVVSQLHSIRDVAVS